MSDPLEGMMPERGKSDPELNDQINLAETVLAALQMASELQRDNGVLPTTVQYQLAVSSEQFRGPQLDLPSDIRHLVDVDELKLAIFTFVFGQLDDRPYVELRLEADDNVVISLAKPGVDEKQPYSGSLILQGKEYDITITSDDVADVIDQIVVPSLDGIPISDPQFPSQSRNIIDTLVQSQGADIVDSSLFDVEIPNDNLSRMPDRYRVQIHKINGQPNEIEVEWILDDQLGFNEKTGEPEQQYRSISATLSFDDFTQSVQFIRIESGQEPIELPRDGELLTMLREIIDKISRYYTQDPDFYDE